MLVSVDTLTPTDLAYPADWPDGDKLYVALMVGEPGNGGLEVVAPEYQRQVLDLTRPPTLAVDATATLYNPWRLAWARAVGPWGQVTHLALVRTKTGTDAVAKVPLTAPNSGLVGEGDLLSFDPNSIKIVAKNVAGTVRLQFSDDSATAAARLYTRYFRETGDALDGDYPTPPGTGTSRRTTAGGYGPFLVIGEGERLSLGLTGAGRLRLG